jgi:hypothetical protein
MRVTLSSTLLEAEGPVQADVFAMDSDRGVLVLRRVHAHTYQKADYFFLPISSITAIALVGAGEQTVLSNIGLAEVQRRLREASAQEERKISCKGVNVKEEDQRLFMDLLKQ